MSKLILPPLFMLKESQSSNKQQSNNCPSMAAEAAIHASRPRHEDKPFIISLPLPEGVAPHRPLAKKGNPTIEIPPLYYNPEEQTGWVYIVASKPNGIIYVGQTTNLPHRIQEHKDGKIPGFTQKYGCKTLVYFEGYPLIVDSIARETDMKNWKREWKVRRILHTNPQWHDLYPAICQVSA